MKAIPKVTFIFLLVFLLACRLHSQVVFSLSSDLDLQRSLKKGQEYWAVGQTITLHFNFNPTNGAYGWIAYFSDGKFNNKDLLAEVKEPGTIPVAIRYNNAAKLSFRHISIGWKHYYTGSSVSESGVGIYSLAGLGILLGRIDNTHSPVADPALYNMPVQPGRATFARTTLDLGLGAEAPVGGGMYLYAEVKTILPLTNYPSPHLLDNNYTPYTAMAALGFRITFN